MFSLIFAVDLVGRHVDEPFHVASVGGFQEDVSSHDVGLGEGKGVPERVVHVRLRRKVHHGVDLLGDDDVSNKIRRTDVSLHKLVVGVILDVRDVFRARAIVQTIKVDNVVLGVVLHQPPHHMRTNEPGPTSDQNSFGGVYMVRHFAENE